MDNRVRQLREIIMKREHHKYRRELDRCLWKEFDERGLSPEARMAERLRVMMEEERPVVLPEERISYLRTISNRPEIYSDEGREALFGKNAWIVGNICPDYATTISTGLDFQRQRCVDRMETADEGQKEFLTCVIGSIDAVLGLDDLPRGFAVFPHPSFRPLVRGGKPQLHRPV